MRVQKKKQEGLKPLTIKLSEEMFKSLDSWASAKSEELGTTVNRSDAVRMLIAQGIK